MSWVTLGAGRGWKGMRTAVTGEPSQVLELVSRAPGREDRQRREAKCRGEERGEDGEGRRGQERTGVEGT